MTEYRALLTSGAQGPWMESIEASYQVVAPWFSVETRVSGTQVSPDPSEAPLRATSSD